MPRNLPKSVTEALDKVEEKEPEASAPEQTPEEMGMTPTFGVPKKRKAVKIPIRQYRVERGPLPSGGWIVVFHGSRSELGMGKVIDERQYDIEKLKKMGVQLTDLGEIEA